MADDSLSAFLAGAAAAIGARHVVTDPADQARHLVEWRGLYRGETPAVLRPGTTAEVAEIVRLAAATRTPLVPQGGNTGLVGGQIPVPGAGEVVVSLERLDRIRAVDAAGYTVTVEAGATLEAVHAAAEAVDRLFPLTLASQGSCRIGGNVSTNAGGTAVLSYGNTRDLVLGLEVVLADGRVLNGLRRLRKDNAGYDLKQLFIGTEGTLGIVTAAVLKLLPRPREVAVAFVGLDGPAEALALLARARDEAGSSVTGFEVMAGGAVAFALRHLAGARRPTAADHPWYVLVEISSGAADGTARRLLETALAEAIEAGEVADAVVASSLGQAAEFWRLRHGLSEVQRHEGASIKHDVSVPLADLPAFLVEAEAAVRAAFPGCRPVPFGHMGDGNIHFNVSQPIGADGAAFLARWDEMNAVVHAVVRRYDGSVAAEHGVGRLKRDLLAETRDPVEIELMRRLKTTLDPLGILNPGRVIQAP
ncbi:FAD-binding oxidoreductase [Oharaeibacter diazotrophicus]|uniref:4-phosphoerythronate dehydrogenase (FAD-dependent) n=1 Tax=Oharaeibacter diazotrophicus TaxID=1920512 RepID=A0A4R6RML5_9HYPH|nr:FAD-binding oxidoreductase [Oharaeibacter diazotrophicus]TDP87415.1 4-phosphoerythronate dehydrogenase (FAD-dependent) [Oharaeibacter diazotrophicus]BBE70641.1 putative FAD-linked oxidoreductase [Pleomorphomonas sp. SM30]GLS77387.1 D-2-hydroxyacid dehydrogenase [Oharaeibacter diazotrophicus]